LGTLVAYLFLRMRAPTWVLLLFTACVFLLALVLVGPGPITDETLERVSSYRYLVGMFGPIPWVGFFTFGVAVDRVKKRGTENFLIVVCVLLFLFSHLLPPLRGEAPGVFLFKVNLRYLVMSVGFLPALFLIFRRAYRGTSSLARTVEYWGRESLVFLVFHWAYIFYLGILLGPFYDRFGETPTVWLTGILTLAIMGMTVGPIARLRDRWQRSEKFTARAWIFFSFSFLGWMVMIGRLVSFAVRAGVQLPDLDIQPAWTPLYANFVIKQSFAFLSAMAFCFVYPNLRMVLRKNSMKPKEKVKMPGGL